MSGHRASCILRGLQGFSDRSYTLNRCAPIRNEVGFIKKMSGACRDRTLTC